MPKSAYNRKGTKSSGKTQIPSDPDGHQVPGPLGREKVRTTQGRTGYTEEKRLGAGGKGRVLPGFSGS